MKSLKEKAAAFVLLAVVAYAATVAFWFLRQGDEWKKAFKAYDAACRRYADENRLIGEKSKWTGAYEDEKAQMPVFSVGVDTDTHWQRFVDRAAERNYIQISDKQAGKEAEAGDVYELPIDVKGWDAALEPLVKFLHELENSPDGMFDVRSISFKPNTAKKGYLKGTMTITCAYMRD